MDNCSYLIYLDEPLFSSDGKKVERTIKMPWCRIIDKVTLFEIYNINPAKELENINECPFPSRYCAVKDIEERSDVYKSLFSSKFITENVKK